MADPSDTLPVNHRRLRSDIAGATPTPWIAAPAGSPLMLRWYVLRNSAPRHANVSPHGRPHLFLLLCSGEPTADRCWDAIATGVAAYGLPVPVCHICPLSYARLYSCRVQVGWHCGEVTFRRSARTVRRSPRHAGLVAGRPNKSLTLAFGGLGRESCRALYKLIERQESIKIVQNQAKVNCVGRLQPPDEDKGPRLDLGIGNRRNWIVFATDTIRPIPHLKTHEGVRVDV